MQTLLPLKHQIVRDLAWSCFGPNIIDSFPEDISGMGSNIRSCPIALTDQRKQWLLQLDEDPQPLVQHLQSLKSSRLGLYFEALWQFFIRQDNKLELIVHNLRVYREKVTLGEFDILYRDLENGEFFHLELAIKYYLNSSTTALNDTRHFSAEHKYWVGPNTVDRLDIKLAHLLNHQIELSALDESIPLLKGYGIESLNKVIALKGMLFYPSINTSSQPFPANISSEHLSHDHLRGQWIHLDKFLSINTLYLHWCHLQKPFWISPAICNNSASLINADSIGPYISDYFSSTSRPAMICGMREDAQGYREVERFFVTANNWPAK
ncbi:MAG: DUF1853 family protein [Oceanicoccus sp.]